MVYKTRKPTCFSITCNFPKGMNQSGITYIDILVTLGVILVLFTVILLTINPVDFQKKGRDNKRISDISLLDRMISEYSLDHKSFPDSLNTTRTSSILPSGNNGPLSKPSDGWIDANLTSYNPVLPIDPKNDATYFYTYRHNASGYELNATLEYLTEYSANDNGNNSNVYEVGNDLTIL